MTNIELQAYEAVKAIARQTARIADTLEAIKEHLKLTPPESGCERDYGTHRVTGGELPTRVDKMPPRMAALAAPFPEPDRQPDVGLPQAVTFAVSE